MPTAPSDTLSLLSVVIPARDEADGIAATLKHLSVELRLKKVPHELVVVDDGSRDTTWETLESLTNIFIILYCWLEKYFSRGDYEKAES